MSPFFSRRPLFHNVIYAQETNYQCLKVFYAVLICWFDGTNDNYVEKNIFLNLLEITGVNVISCVTNFILASI